MLHKRRITDKEALVDNVQAFMAKLRRDKSFYTTPPGSNDDWYGCAY